MTEDPADVGVDGEESAPQEADGEVPAEEEVVEEEPAAQEADEEEPAEKVIEEESAEEIVEEVVVEPVIIVAAEESQDAGTVDYNSTLNMADYTGIFIYIALPDGANASEYTVEASGGSYRQSYAKPPVAVSDLEKGSGARANMYQFEALRAASSEMTDEVTVTVTVKKDNQVVKSEAFSVYSVAQAMLAKGTLVADQVNLLKGLLQYGYYGHIIFNNPLQYNPVIDGAPAMTAIPSSYAPKNDPTDFGAYVTKFEDKLNLASVISMNLYLTLANGYSMNDFTFRVMDQNGKAYGNSSVSAASGNRVLVTIGGIKSPQMAKHFNIAVTLKSDASKTAIWTRSVWICAYQGSARTSGDGLKLLQALYQYGIYAQKQFPNACDPDPTTAVIGDLVYEFNSSTTCRVKSYAGQAASLTVPEIISTDDPTVPPVFRGAIVMEIGPSAFEGNTKLESIDLPDSIMTIAYRAFAGCTNLSRMN